MKEITYSRFMPDIPSAREIHQEAIMARPESMASPTTEAGKMAAKLRADAATKGPGEVLKSEADIFEARKKPEGISSLVDKQVEKTARDAIGTLLEGDAATNATGNLDRILAFTKNGTEGMDADQVNAIVADVKTIVESSTLLNEWLVREGGDPEALKHILEDPAFQKMVQKVLGEKFKPDGPSWKTDEDIIDDIEPEDIRAKRKAHEDAEEAAQKIKDERDDRDREKDSNGEKLKKFDEGGERAVKFAAAHETIARLAPTIEGQKRTYELNMREYQRLLDTLPRTGGRDGGKVIYPPDDSAVGKQMKEALKAAKEAEGDVLEHASAESVIATFHTDQDALKARNEQIDREQRASKVDLDQAEREAKALESELDTAVRARAKAKEAAAASKEDPKVKLESTLNNVFLEAADKYFGEQIAKYETAAREAAKKRATEAEDAVSKKVHQALSELHHDKDRKSVIRRRTRPGERAVEYMDDLKDITKGPEAVLKKILIRQGYSVDRTITLPDGTPKVVQQLSEEGKKLMENADWVKKMKARVTLDVVTSNLINGAYKKKEMSEIVAAPWFASALEDDDSDTANKIKAKIAELQKKDGTTMSTAKWLNNKAKSPLGLATIFMLLGPIPMGAVWLMNRNSGGGHHAAAA